MYPPIPVVHSFMYCTKDELSFINTNHPDFVGGDGAITSILEKMISQKQELQGQPNNPNANPFVCGGRGTYG